MGRSHIYRESFFKEERPSVALNSDCGLNRYPQRKVSGIAFLQLGSAVCSITFWGHVSEGSHGLVILKKTVLKFLF